MSEILCIVDSYRWALANRARNLKSNLTSHNFTIKHFNEVKNLNLNNFDIVYSLNWPIHGYIKGKLQARRRYRLVTTISSHIGRGNAKTMRSIFSGYDAISTSNNMLYKEFRPVYGEKVYNTPFGVNTDLFKKKNEPENFSSIFGWVGNASRDVKRFKVIEQTFKGLGPKYELKTAKSNDGLTREEMVDFYNSIGTIICFSRSEGTPNPILEGAACGRAIISTPVGNVPELVKNNKEIALIQNKNQLREMIVCMAKDKSRIARDGRFLENEITNSWNWRRQSNAFIPFLGLKFA